MATKNPNAKISVPTPGRYAHPFFTPVPPEQRQSVNGNQRMTDWSKQQLGPIPPVARGGKMDLTEIIGAQGVQEIVSIGEIRFHALGDSGVGMATEAEHVSDEMATDYKPGAGGLNPAFLLHLGDVIYGPDKEAHYGDRLYRPYRHYPGKILAIPGNHDGEVKVAKDSPSLNAFQANFCAATATVPPAASGIGVFRETMTQPGVYWMLEAPFARIIGLYSNLLENPGFLDGANGDQSQLKWLSATLAGIAAKKDHKALIIATHHPPFSQAGHSGSTEMHKSITDACTAAGILPHAILSAHAHSYQRFTQRVGNQRVLYIVSGGGGMPPQPVPPASGQPADATHQVTYDAALQSLGYLFVTVTAGQLKTEFWPLGQQTKAFDPVTMDLAAHTVA